MTENPTLVEELRESARLAAAKAKCPVEDYITWSAANEIERLRGTAQASTHPMALSDLLTGFKIDDSTLRDILWAWREPDYPSVQEVLEAQQFAADQIDAIVTAIRALSVPSTRQNTPPTKAWSPDQFWEYAEGLTDAFVRDQMRDTMAERGLAVTSTTRATPEGE